MNTYEELRKQRKKREAKVKKIKLVIFSILILFILYISLQVAYFFRGVEAEKMNDCASLPDNTSEPYFECLQQNNLDTWDMNNQHLALAIVFWLSLIVGTVFISILVLMPTYFITEGW